MAKLTILEAHELIEDAIKNGTRHGGYLRAIALKEDYKTAITGKGYARFLTRFVRRESIRDFLQRLDLTHENLSSTLNPILRKVDQLSRVQDIKKGLYFTNTTRRDQEDLRLVLEDFGGEGTPIKGSLEDYVTRNYDQVALYDPNAFIVVEFESFDARKGERARPYAVRFDCENVLDFRYTRGDLDYLLVALTVNYRGPKRERLVATDFVLYGGKFAMRYYLIADGRDDIPDAGEEFKVTDTVRYRGVEFNPGIDEIPAIRIGDFPDPETEGQICVSRILHPIMSQCRELINLKSQRDIIVRKHGFPRTYERAPLCEGEPDPEFPGGHLSCNKGKKDDGSDCRACNGTGFETFHSEQDRVMLKLEENQDPKELVDLSQLIYTEKPDKETIEMLNTMLLNLKQEIFITIYSSDQQVKTQGPVISETATAQNISREDQNNTLLPIADHKGIVIETLIRFCVKIMSISGEVKAPYKFARDLKLTSAEELLQQIADKADKVSGVAIEQLYDDYYEKVYQADSAGLEWHYWKKAHIPFYLASEENFQFYVTAGYVTQNDRTRRVYYDTIEADLRQCYPGILDMPYDKQEELIDEIVEEIIANLPKDVSLTQIPTEKEEKVPQEV